MKSIKELVAQYGSTYKLADAIGVHRPQVSRWVKLNAHIDENGDVYIKTRSVKPVDGITNEWKEIAAKALAVLQVNGIPLIGDYPERCLREIRAQDGMAGYLVGYRAGVHCGCIGLSNVFAEEYAERIKRGEE